MSVPLSFRTLFNQHGPRGGAKHVLGNAWSRVLNISMGEMTVAEIVRARPPANSGAGVRLAPMDRLFGSAATEEAFKEETCIRGSSEEDIKGEMWERRYS